MPRQPSTTTRHILNLEGSRADERDDRLAVEEPLEIRVDGRPIAVTMRTPGDDVDLGAGFCLTEGVVTRGDEIDAIEPCTEADYGNIVGVSLTPEAATRRAGAIERATRQMTVNSSCGLCSKQTIDRVLQDTPPLETDFKIDPAVIVGLSETMRARQSVFDQTGGLHAGAIFTHDGDLCVLREDIGRHNAVDKAVGHLLMRDGKRGETGGNGSVLLVSGRAGFEIVQKAAMARISVVCAVGAPSSMAVDFADRVGQTLIGFLRDSRMNIYTHSGRIVR